MEFSKPPNVYRSVVSDPACFIGRELSVKKGLAKVLPATVFDQFKRVSSGPVVVAAFPTIPTHSPIGNAHTIN